jgi:opacity protein-like surface antigen
MKQHRCINHCHYHIISLAAGAALVSAAATAHAQPQVAPPPGPVAVNNSGDDLGFFLNSDFGASFMPDFQSSRLGFPGNFSMRPGLRFDAGPGYNFFSTDKLTLGAAFETGILYNRLHSVTDELGAPTTFRGDFYQVPLLADLELKIRVNDFIIPYVGLGGGGDISRAKLNRFEFPDIPPGAPGVTSFPYRTDNTEIDPAVQGMAGVRFRLAPNMEFGVGYKFLAAFANEGTALENHSAMASFSVKF